MNQDRKRIGRSLKGGLKTLKIYFRVSNYILKTSYGDNVDNEWLFLMRLQTGRWESDRGEGGENCQKPLNALGEEIQQFKKISWGVKLSLPPVLSIML